MKQNKIDQKLAEYITSNKGDKTANSTENLLHENSSLSKEEVNNLKNLYTDLGNIELPLPSDSMKINFQKKLDDYKLKNTINPRFKINWTNLAEIFGLRTNVLKPAFFVIIFLLGTIAGVVINNGKTQTNQLISELQNSQKTLMLTLLEQPSATQRLKAVNLSDNLNAPDEIIINALFTTLNNDENVNVRMAAIEALFKYSNQPEVREGLIESIPHQNSPLVLITLSKAMVILQEKGSVKKLKQFLKDNQMDENVKNQINKNIQKLI